MTDVITGIFREYFKERERKELSRAPDTVIYATEASNICMRLVFLNRKSITDYSLESQFRILTGDLHHQFLQQVLLPWAKKNKTIKDYDIEKRFVIDCSDVIKRANCVIHGRVDGVIETEDKTYAIEIKPGQSKLKEEQYKMQLTQGLFALKIKHGLEYFYNCASGIPTEKYIKLDEKYAVKPIERAVAISDCLRNNNLPFPEAKMNEDIKWQCGRICPFREVCT